MIQLVYQLTTDLDDEEERDSGLQHWLIDIRYSERDEDGETYDDPHSVGTLSAVVVTSACGDPARMLDEISQDLSDVGIFFFFTRKDDFADLDWTNTLILDRMDLASSVRGQGLGPAIATEVMCTFAALGCGAAIGMASSYDEASEAPEGGYSLETRNKLCALWEQAGMKRVNPPDGYLYADLSFMEEVQSANALTRSRCVLVDDR